MNKAYKYTQKAYKEVQQRYNDRLIILEGPNAYWTYFRDALTISRLINQRAYTNRHSVPGITFPKEQISTVLFALDRANISWIVCDATHERLSKKSMNHVPTEKSKNLTTIGVGNYVKVRINGAEEREFLIRDKNSQPHVVQVSPDCMIKSTSLPTYPKDSISIESPVGKALLGHQIGDGIIIPGGNNKVNTYQILNVRAA